MGIGQQGKQMTKKQQPTDLDVRRLDAEAQELERGAQSAEISDVDYGAYYDVPDVTEVEGKDPRKVYYWASKQARATQPGSIDHAKRRGYVVSSIKQEHPDCVLMELDREIYERREMLKYAKRLQKKRETMRPPDGLEVLERSRHGIGGT